MRVSLRITSALTLSVLILIGLTATVHAAAGQMPLTDRLAPTDPAPAFVRIVTVTIEPSPDPMTPGYTSYWETESISQLLASYIIPVPSDATDLDIRLTQGSFAVITGTEAITIQITGEQPWFYFAYRTQLRALRSSHQVLIQQSASNNLPYRYLGTVIFSAPQQYVGTMGTLPQALESDQARWDLIPPRVEIQPGLFRYRFNATSVLADPRLDWPDLAVTNAALTINRAFAVPTALVTVTVMNSSTLTTSVPVYLNLYDRIAPAPVPTGPLDLTDGWCIGGVYPSCPVLASFTNPITIGPAGFITLTASFPVTRAGLHQFHLQVDALGGPVGLNAESNEINNLIGLGEAQIAWVYLPIIRR